MVSIPAPYSLPVASAGTLGGVKVGTGLNADENGVLSSTAAPLVVDIEMNVNQHTVILRNPTPTKAEIKNALVSGRPVIGLHYSQFGSVIGHCLCTGRSLPDMDGVATFYYIDVDGSIAYGNIGIND